MPADKTMSSAPANLLRAMWIFLHSALCTHHSALHLFLAAIAASCTCTTTRAAAPTTTQQWVDQLTAADPSVRDQAEAHLADSDKSTVDLLKPLLNDDRSDVRQRAARALRHIRLFALHGVSDNALHAAQLYLHATAVIDRKHQLNILFQMSPPPNIVIARLITLETDDELRRLMLYQLGTGYRDAVVGMLADDDDLPAVISLLNEAATMWGRGQAADDAMALYLTGKIDDQIDICRAEQINGDSDERDHSAARLCYLYRVCGKYDEALKFARFTRDPSLIFLVLQDKADWVTAAREPDDRWRDPIMAAGFKATFQRLSNHPTEAMKTIAPMSGMAQPDKDGSYNPSRVFLLNDQPERGIELLTAEHPVVAFQMHYLRGDIAAALGVAKLFANHPLEGSQLRAESDRLLQSLGELPLPQTRAPARLQPQPDAWADAVRDLNDKQFTRAADEFGAQWDQDHWSYGRLYLQGYALNAAGDTHRGQALMKTAELIPLGSPELRLTFARRLELAGLEDVARQQRELALRSGGSYDDIGLGEVYYAVALDAMKHRQWHAAAESLDRLCVVELSPQFTWPNFDQLLTVPALAHLMKATDARERHDLTTALAELKMYQQYEPCSSDMVVEWTPALDEVGEHTRADEIFNSVYEKLADICQKYPKSPDYLNRLAWMSACCDRRLDEALKAAQTCVQMTPDDYKVLDTLAEVHFRRGERTAAIEIEKKAAGLSDDSYIARQLKRFESGDIPSKTQPGKVPE